MNFFTMNNLLIPPYHPFPVLRLLTWFGIGSIGFREGYEDARTWNTPERKHNAVEGRNPVGGHEEERISQVEDFTHLTRFHLGDSGKVEGKDGIRRHGENVVPEWGRPKRNMEGRLRLTRGFRRGRPECLSSGQSPPALLPWPC